MARGAAEDEMMLMGVPGSRDGAAGGAGGEPAEGASQEGSPSENPYKHLAAAYGLDPMMLHHPHAALYNPYLMGAYGGVPPHMGGSPLSAGRGRGGKAAGGEYAHPGVVNPHEAALMYSAAFPPYGACLHGGAHHPMRHPLARSGYPGDAGDGEEEEERQEGQEGRGRGRADLEQQVVAQVEPGHGRQEPHARRKHLRAPWKTRVVTKRSSREALEWRADGERTRGASRP